MRAMRWLWRSCWYVFVFVIGFEAYAQDSLLTRAPNLQQCAHDSAVIAWKTATPQRSEIHFSADKSFERKLQSDTAATFHVLTLRKLLPEQLYHYRVLVAGRVAYESSFRTYPEPATQAQNAFAFWLLGDGGSGGPMQRAVAEQVVKLVHEDAVQFGLYLGDIVYEKGAEIAQDPHYFTPYQKILDRQVCWPALGNHDTHIDEGAPYYNNRVLPVPDTLADLWRPERWYAFTYGSALFIALDSRAPENQTQLAFLRHQLETHREAEWKFVFFHHPPYATPYTKKSKCRRMSEMDVRAAWSPTFEEFEVDFVFTGHNHSYQRSELRRDYFPEKRGVYYLVSGGGGESAHAVAQSDSACHQPPLQQAAALGETFHFAWAKIDGDTFTLRAVDVNGNVIDTFEYRKSASRASERIETEQ